MRTKAQSSRARVVTLALAALGVAAGVASCKKEKKQAPPRELTLGLSWVHQAQFAGPYYADQKGLYAEEGLRVEFVPASIENDPLDEFLAGKYDFVIAQPEKLLQARLAGHDIKAIAATYRIHPLVFISLQGSGITTPQDFRGKTIGVAYSEKLLLLALLRKMQIDPGEVNIVQRKYGFESLQKGEVMVQAGWLTDELQTARRAGLALNVISPYDYGITFYADVLTARESLIVQEPELVQRFVRATMRGWAESLQDPAANATLPLKYDSKLDPAHEAAVLKATAPLIHTGVDQIGWMRAADWDEMIRALHDEGVISQRPAAGDVYTTRFLQAIQQP